MDRREEQRSKKKTQQAKGRVKQDSTEIEGMFADGSIMRPVKKKSQLGKDGD